MENLILFLLEFGIYLTCFYLLYKILLDNSKDHGFSRFYLVSSFALSLLIPMLPKSLVQPELVFGVILNPIEISAKGTTDLLIETNASFPILGFIGSIYLIITILFIARFLFGIFRIYFFKINGTREQKAGIEWISSASIKSPFSFFQTIYLPKGLSESESTDLILKHEKSHIKYGHSIEKVFFTFFKAIFWFHPIVYKYAKELELVHEYQVDAYLTQNLSKKYYSEFLLSQINFNIQYSFTNNISSQVKNRIIMLSNEKKKSSMILNWASYLVLFGLLIICHSCSVDDDEDEVLDRNYTIVTEQTDSNSNFTMEDIVEEVVIFNTETQKETIREIIKKVKVYKAPDAMPVFEGCAEISDNDQRKECSNQKLLTHVYSNIIYPAAAKNEGIEGMVVTDFIIDTDGKIANPRVVREIGGGTTEAVLELLNAMNDQTTWTPGRVDGKDVAVKFTMPIKFKLQG